MITIVGMGPGSIDYIPPIGLKAIAQAEIIIGDDRWLSLFPDSPAEKRGWRPIEGLIDKLEADGDRKRIAVLVGGDPGLCSLLQTIRGKSPALSIEVIPGISASQVLFARLGLDWSQVEFVSLHGRSLEDLTDRVSQGGDRFCVLADFNNTPLAIGRSLLAGGYAGRAVVGENLTGGDEKVLTLTLDELAKHQSHAHAVVYLEIQR